MQRIGVFICHCGTNIAATVDVKKVVETVKREDGVVFAADYPYMCSENGQQLIQNAIKEQKLTGIVIGSCSPRMHEATFKKAAAQAGLNEAMPLYWQSALWTAALLFAMNLVSGLLVCWFYGRGAALRRGLPAVLVLSLVQGGGELLMSQVNTTLCCFIPCCLALVVSLLLGRLPLYNTPWELENSRAMKPSRGTLLSEQAPQGMGILHAFSPYLVMTAFSLVCLLIPSVKRALAGVSVSLHIPAVVSGGTAITEEVSGFSPLSLTNAGVFLFLAAGFGSFYFRRRGWLTAGSGQQILRDSLKKAWPSSVSVMVFLVPIL